MPAATAVTANTTAGRTSRDMRRPSTTPTARPESPTRSGRPGTERTAASAATAAAAHTTPQPVCAASHTPSGRATNDGTPLTTPTSASPSPRRSAGMSDAVNAPPATTVRASPRTG